MTDDHRDKIFDFYTKHHRMPSYTEIMRLVGFRSKNAVYKLINKLVEQGIVIKDATGRLAPTKLLGEVPLLGLVEAGFPTSADETELDTMSLDDYLIDKKDRTYLLRVKGDSMIDAGIQEGDLVIAERGREAKPGDIVIADVDGGWTMKYLRKKGSQIYLQPANDKYEDIYPTESLNVAAVVRGVVRRY